MGKLQLAADRTWERHAVSSSLLIDLQGLEQVVLEQRHRGREGPLSVDARVALCVQTTEAAGTFDVEPGTRLSAVDRKIAMAKFPSTASELAPGGEALHGYRVPRELRRRGVRRRGGASAPSPRRPSLRRQSPGLPPAVKPRSALRA